MSNVNKNNRILWLECALYEQKQRELEELQKQLNEKEETINQIVINRQQVESELQEKLQFLDDIKNRLEKEQSLHMSLQHEYTLLENVSFHLLFYCLNITWTSLEHHLNRNDSHSQN